MESFDKIIASIRIDDSDANKKLERYRSVLKDINIELARTTKGTLAYEQALRHAWLVQKSMFSEIQRNEAKLGDLRHEFKEVAFSIDSVVKASKEAEKIKFFEYLQRDLEASKSETEDLRQNLQRLQNQLAQNGTNVTSGIKLPDFSALSDVGGSVFNSFGGQANILSTVFSGVKNIGSALGGLSGAGVAGAGGVAAIAGVAAPIGAALAATIGLTVAIGNLEKELQKLMVEVSRFSKLQGDSLLQLTSNFKSLSEFFKVDFADLTKATTGLMRATGASSQEAFGMIEEAMLRGANTSGQFLDRLARFSTEYKKAGISAKEFMEIASLESRAGKFTDVLLDGIKDFGLSVRDMSVQSQASLRLLGDDFVRKLVSNMRSGTVSAVQATKLVFEQSQKAGIAQRDLVKITEALGLSSVQELGGLSEAYHLLNVSQNEVNLTTEEYYKQQKELLQIEKALQAETDKFLSTFHGLGNAIDKGTSQVSLFGMSLLSHMTEGFRATQTELNKAQNGFVSVAKSMDEAQINERIEEINKNIGEFGDDSDTVLERFTRSMKTLGTTTFDTANIFVGAGAAIKTFFENGGAAKKMRLELNALNNEIARRDENARRNAQLATDLENELIYKQKIRGTLTNEDAKALENYQKQLDALKAKQSKIGQLDMTPKDGLFGGLGTVVTVESLNSEMKDLLSKMQVLGSSSEDILAANDAMRQLRRETQDAKIALKDMRLETVELSTQTLELLPKAAADFAIQMTRIDVERQNQIVQERRKLEDLEAQYNDMVAARDVGVTEEIFAGGDGTAAMKINEANIKKMEGNVASLKASVSATISEINAASELKKKNLGTEFFRSQFEALSNLEDYISMETIPELLSYYEKAGEEAMLKNKKFFEAEGLTDTFKKVLNEQIATFEKFYVMQAQVKEREINFEKEILRIDKEIAMVTLTSLAMETQALERQGKFMKGEMSRNLSSLLMREDDLRRGLPFQLLNLQDIDAGTWALKKQLRELEMQGLRANLTKASEERVEAEEKRLNEERRMSADYTKLKTEEAENVAKIQSELDIDKEKARELDGKEDKASVNARLALIDKIKKGERDLEAAREKRDIALKNNEAETKNKREALSNEVIAAQKAEEDAKAAIKEKEMEREKERIKNIKDGIKALKDAAIEAARLVTQTQIEEVEKQIEIQYRRLEEFKRVDERGRTLADKGNAEMLQAEEQRLAELAKQKEAYVRRQKVLDLIQFASASAVAIAQAAAAGKGFASFATIAAVIAAIIGGVAQISAMSNAASTASAFEKGGPIDGGEQLIRVNEKGTEFVINAQRYKENKDLVHAVHEGKVSEFLANYNAPHKDLIIAPQKPETENRELIKEVRALRRDNRELKGSMSSRISGEDISTVVNVRAEKAARIAKRR